MAEERELRQGNQRKESPIKILVNLYSVIAGLAAAAAVRFLIGSENGEIRGPFSIPRIDFYIFLSFFLLIVPFYQGAITYLHNTYHDKYSGKKWDILVDFLHLLAESMVFYAMASSLSNIFIFLTWIILLIFIDTVWIISIKIRNKITPSDQINEPPDVWFFLNFIFITLIFILWDLHSIMPNTIEGESGHITLILSCFFRTLLDYILSKPFYFG